VPDLASCTLVAKLMREATIASIMADAVGSNGARSGSPNDNLVRRQVGR
jgi:hypothetical protein